ncbi:CatA-like O-acetyltransferase [Kiloniella laminariae]|uniref:CatA-like O-acetyltransferase n=1 Tax=Kiloniella laminariae TaxID=454162 RepID=A0ABT4LF30_9PROT|nr:CatA-like O-acetyltransferase [Kiloniella laminariae]MCZ4279711.1 CatA-like O-acetyltransferase [Kiloniella laminariae]
MVKKIDLNSWSRRSQYQLFKGFANPHVSITGRVDVTPVMLARQRLDISPFNALLYCLMKAVNAVPELRCRFREEDIIEHAVINPSVTVPIEDDGFAFCEVDYCEDWDLFNQRCQIAVSAAKTQPELKDNTSHRDDWIYGSCLPWLAFTAMQHPLCGPDDCIPRIAWGKITSAENNPAHPAEQSWQVPVNITAHHALVDGLHIARFFQKLEKIISDFPT